MGDEGFRRAFRNIYLASAKDYRGIDQLSTIFKGEATDGTALTAVNAAIDRWYHGPTSAGLPPFDAAPPDPPLVGLNARVDGIAVTGQKPENPPFSADKMSNWPNLTFHYTVPDGVIQFRLVILAYTDDGTLISNRDIRFVTGRAGSLDTRTNVWTSTRKWNPGNYHVHVYHEGKKVAQTSFEVSP